MADPSFYTNHGPFTIERLINEITAAIACDGDTSLVIKDVAALGSAGIGDLSFCATKMYFAALAETKALACLIKECDRAQVPAHVTALVVDDPERVFAVAAALFYPHSSEVAGISPEAIVHASANLESDVSVAPGAVICAGVEIGTGSTIGANAVIGSNVKIGRNCSIQANAVVEFALIGNEVTIQPGAVIGGDGFGYAMGPAGHLKIPQIGRVIIQDRVDIGSGTTIDRGAAEDTLIGEGTKIDNLVQIGHNCVIGRHCIIAGMVGLAGSTQLGDFVVLGGNAGTAGHLSIGDGAQVAGKAGVTKSLPGGQIYAGYPVRPVMQWRREVGALARLAKHKKK